MPGNSSQRRGSQIAVSKYGDDVGHFSQKLDNLREYFRIPHLFQWKDVTGKGDLRHFWGRMKGTKDRTRAGSNQLKPRRHKKDTFLNLHYTNDALLIL